MKAPLLILVLVTAAACSDPAGVSAGDSGGDDVGGTDGSPDTSVDVVASDVAEEIDAGPDSADVAPDADDGCAQWVGNVFQYEASRPDATAESHGLDGASVCSRAGVLPWVEVTWAEASAACATLGATLCSGPAWDAACKGEGGSRYPYGADYDPDACNVLESPDGCLNACRVAATGQYDRCVSAAGALDMSGNVGEWVADERPFGQELQYEVRGGSYFSANDATIQCRDGHTWRTPDTRSPELGFRCCR